MVPALTSRPWACVSLPPKDCPRPPRSPSQTRCPPCRPLPRTRSRSAAAASLLPLLHAYRRRSSPWLCPSSLLPSPPAPSRQPAASGRSLPAHFCRCCPPFCRLALRRCPPKRCPPTCPLRRLPSAAAPCRPNRPFGLRLPLPHKIAASPFLGPVAALPLPPAFFLRAPCSQAALPSTSRRCAAASTPYCALRRRRHCPSKRCPAPKLAARATLQAPLQPPALPLPSLALAPGLACLRSAALSPSLPVHLSLLIPAHLAAAPLATAPPRPAPPPAAAAAPSPLVY